MSGKKDKQKRRQEKLKQMQEAPVNKTKLAVFCEKMICSLIYVILFFPAIVFSPWHLNSFELPKNVIFLFLAGWLVAFYLIYKFETRQWKFSTSQKIVLMLMAGLFIFKIISLILALNKDISFWGTYTRQEGFVTHLFLALFFIVALEFIKNKKQLKKYLLVVSLTAGIIALYGVLQKFGIDFKALEWEDDAYRRVASTLGNPLFLSLYLIFAFGYSAYCFKEFKNIYLKIVVAASAILQLLAIVFTFTSSSFLAIAAGLSFYLFFYFWLKNKKIAFVILAIAILGATFLGLVVFNKIQISFLSDLSINSLSNLQRIYVWESSLQAATKHYWFGWGNDCYSQAFDYAKSTDLLPPFEKNFDRAHNFILDRLLMEGLLVAVIYLVILIYSIVIGLRRYFKNKNVIYLIAASLLFMFIANGLVSIPAIMSYIMLSFSLAIIFYKVKKESVESQKLIGCQNSRIWIYLLLLTALIYCSWIFWLPWRADLTLQKAIASNDYLRREEYLQQAIDLWPVLEYKGELYKTQKQIIKIAASQDENIAANYQQQAQVLIDHLIKNYGNRYMMQVMAADYYELIKNEEKMNYHYQAAQALAPQRFEIYWFWGDSFLRLEKNNQAIEKYQQAIDLDNNQPYPYKMFSQLYKKLENKELYQEYYDIYKRKFKEQYFDIKELRGNKQFQKFFEDK